MDTHLHHHHHEEHLTSTDLIKDIVIGMSDGLTVPFALAAGLSGVHDIQTSVIVLAGIAEISAGSIAMGLGGYLAGKTEQDHYANELAREYEEVERLPQREEEEVRDFFVSIGLSHDACEQAVADIIKDKDRWVDFMMRYELNLEKPDPKRATQSAFNIGVSYIVGGLVPLSPYIFIKDAHMALYMSVIVTLISLYIFGFFKSKMTGVNPWWGAFRVMLIGAAAAAAAFGIAQAFGRG